MTEANIQKLRDILADMQKREIIGKQICPATCKSAQDYEEMYHDVKVLKEAKTHRPEWVLKNPLFVIFAFSYAPVLSYILYRFLDETGELEQQGDLIE